MPTETWISVADAAEFAGVTTSYIRQLIRKEEIRHQKPGAAFYLVHAGDVKKLKNATSTVGRPRSGAEKQK